MKDKGINYPILLDPQGSAAQLYGLRATPTSYLIDKQGTILGGTIGPKQWDSEAAQQLVRELATQ